MRRGAELSVLLQLARAGLWGANRQRVGLWYHPEYDPPGMAAAFQLTGLLPNRNQLLLGKLLEKRIIRRRHVRPSPLASFADLSLVHPVEYLESITRPEMLERVYGYPVNPDEAEQLLSAQRRGVGGTVAAAQAVASGQLEVGINVGGGFHHAEAAKGSGYCVFNDVAIAIASLRRSGYLRPIAIVDLDFHQGNGNLRIFERDRSVLTYSLHGVVWDPDAAESDFGSLLPPGASDEEYLRELRATLPKSLERHRPGIVFYIAGNDVLAGDRLGTFQLSPAGVLERDRLVHRAALDVGAPLVVALGGGYSPLAWQCTANFISWLRTGSTRARENWEPDLRSKFSEIAETLTAEALRDSPKAETQPLVDSLTEADVLGDLGRLAHPRQFLDYYSSQGVEFAFEKYGILPKLRKQGFTDAHLVTDPSDPARQTVRIISGPEKNILLELVAGKVSAAPPAWSGLSRDLQFLNVNWLLLQHPSAPFGHHRPALPGQAHPGLGIAEDVMELLVQSCRRTGLDGIQSVPSHYHGAAVASRWAHFLEPEREGRLLAMRHVLFRFHLWAASEVVQTGGLLLEDSSPVKWEPAIQIVPVSPTMKTYFESSAYHSRALEECQRLLRAGLHVSALSEQARPY
ncbi:MAG: histone deacetylase [Oligoflexia bacterium]|nr:histone deacetylase [Oligoflexia bacterium]